MFLTITKCNYFLNIFFLPSFPPQMVLWTAKNYTIWLKNNHTLEYRLWFEWSPIKKTQHSTKSTYWTLSIISRLDIFSNYNLLFNINYRLNLYVPPRKRFEIAIFVLIFLNMLTMGIEHYNQPHAVFFILEVSNAFFTTVFGLGK